MGKSDQITKIPRGYVLVDLLRAPVYNGGISFCLNVKSKFNYITRLHNVGFAFGANFAGSSGG